MNREEFLMLQPVEQLSLVNYVAPDEPSNDRTVVESSIYNEMMKAYSPEVVEGSASLSSNTASQVTATLEEGDAALQYE